jgi:hypothetical protein
MRLQARGEVDKAWAALTVAAEQLPPMMVNRVHGEARVVVTPRPARNFTIEYLTWWVSQVTFREQRELLMLRTFFGASGRTREEQLAMGCVEHRRWIEFDRWVSKLRTAKAEGISVTPTRAVICTRANRLVRWVDPTARELDDIRGWKAAGGYARVGRLSLELVANGPREPWTKDNRGTAHIPVRDGRRLLYEFATQ